MTLLGAAEIRELAEELGIKPAKSLGQNFVIDANVCRKIVRTAGVISSDVALEIGPGLGSLTLALLEEAKSVIAVEIDERLATRLPQTIAAHNESAATFSVIHQDALHLKSLPEAPTVLVANLPYNVSVPVLLHLLEIFPTLKSGVVMVQAEVADRMAAGPGSKIYGVPSVKMAWYGEVTKAGSVGRNVFWPAPNVDSGLVRLVRKERDIDPALRELTFTIVDAAFGQRRKTLRTALGSALGSPQIVEGILRDAGVDPGLRGEQLSLQDFVAIAQSAKKVI